MKLATTNSAKEIFEETPAVAFINITTIYWPTRVRQ